MYFSHGSSKNIKNTEYNELDVFDYIIDNKGKISRPEIDNGNDGEGIGINAFIGDSNEAIDSAVLYTSENSSYVYILEVDIDEDELMNNRSPDDVPVDDLVLGIEAVLKEIRHINNCSKEKFDDLINSFEDNFENITLDRVNENLQKENLDLELDEYSDPSDYDDFHEWKEKTEESYNLQEYCSRIIDEGGSYEIARNAIDSSNNLWETIRNIGDNISIYYSNKGTEKYNKTYQRMMCRTLSDHRLIASYVDNDNFAVIFDVDEIKIKKVIDFNLDKKLKELTSLENPSKKEKNRKIKP